MMEKGWPCATEPCDGAPWRHRCVSNDGEAVVVRLWRAGRRGDEGESSGAQELAQGEVMEGYPRPWPSAALSTWQRGKFQFGALSCTVQG